MKKEFLVVVVLIFILSNMVIPFMLFAILYNIEINRFILSTLFQVLIYGGISLLLMKKHDLPLSRDEIRVRSLGMIMKIIFSGIIIFSLLRVTRDSLRLIYVGITGDVFAFYNAPLMGWGALLLSIVFFALIPSIFEELFFRVLPYRMLKEAYTPEKMVIVTAIIFSLFHLNAGLQSMLSALALGIILMSRFIKQKSYLEIVILHFLYNFFVILFNNRLMFPTDISFINICIYSKEEALFVGSLFLALPLVVLSLHLFFKKDTDLEEK